MCTQANKYVCLFHFSLVNVSFVSLIYRVPANEPKMDTGKKSYFPALQKDIKGQEGVIYCFSLSTLNRDTIHLLDYWSSIFYCYKTSQQLQIRDK